MASASGSCEPISWAAFGMVVPNWSRDPEAEETGGPGLG